MRVTTFITAAMLLLSESTAAKELLYRPRGHRTRDLDGEMRRAAFEALHRRQTSSSNITPTNPTINDMNATIASACISALSDISSVANQAGITACYNILQHDLERNTFQADLRLYLAGEPAGDFRDVESGDMMIGVTYPLSTSFSSAMKRAVKRQTSSMTEMQQYTLNGFFKEGMDMSKLNTTELMSLMVPQITINSVLRDTQTPIATNVTSTDMVYFVVGDFSGEFDDAVVTAQLQQIAIDASSEFVLPGTTLGIFPTGLIVTGAWMVLFFIAYGVGTLSRLRHRRVYRQRKLAVGGRTGKKF